MKEYIIHGKPQLTGKLRDVEIPYVHIITCLKYLAHEPC
jgi:hypothetical protein